MIFKCPHPGAEKVWRVAMTVKGVLGIIIGCSTFIWGVLFYEQFASISTPAFAIGMTTGLYGLLKVLNMLLEIPTGAIGDALGRKWSVVLSYGTGMFYFLLMALIPFCSHLGFLIGVAIAAMCMSALSFTFFSGSFTAWCVDTLRHQAPDVGYEQLLAPANRFYFVGLLVGGVASIFLYLNGIPSLSFMLGAIGSFAMVVYCMGEMEQEKNIVYVSIREVNLARITQRMGEIVGVGFGLFRSSRSILILVLIYAGYFGVLHLTDYLWPIYLRSSIPLELQRPYWVGLVIVLQVASFLGSHGLTLWTRRWHGKEKARVHNHALRRVFVASCFMASIPVLFLSFMTARGLDTFWLLILAILPVRLAYGILPPIFSTLINNYIPDTHAGERATIISLASLVTSLLVFLIAIPTGGPSGEKSPIGWGIPAMILLVVTLVGNHFLKKAEKKAPEIMPIRVDSSGGEASIPDTETKNDIEDIEGEKHETVLH